MSIGCVNRGAIVRDDGTRLQPAICWEMEIHQLYVNLTVRLPTLALLKTDGDLR